MRNSIHSLVEKRVAQAKKGSLLFPSDFRTTGSDSAVKSALIRLAKEGKLVRLAHGIYMVPEIDPLLNIIRYPPLEEMAKAIAKRDHARIRPAGTYALHKLGLSTQVPMNLVYLTDGAPRKIKIGNGSIKFKATTAKKLSLKGPLSSLIIQALEELGQKNVTPDIWNKVEGLLNRERGDLLDKDLKVALGWVSKKLRELIKKQAND